MSGMTRIQSFSNLTLTPPAGMDTVVIPILEVRKLRFGKELNSFSEFRQLISGIGRIWTLGGWL